MSASHPPAASQPPRRRWQAPSGDGSLLSQPPLADGVEVAARNAASLRSIDLDIQGHSWQTLRQLARDQALTAAREYTQSLSPLAPAGGEGPGVRGERLSTPNLLFVTGHQPALFHPGVWVKNFAIGRLASRASNAVSLNLLVDNDVMTSVSTSVRVPVGSREAPRLEAIPFDDPRPAQPWEEAEILNRDLFRSFAERVSESLRTWGIEPLVTELWPAAFQHLERSPKIADCLTAARNQLEQRWGVSNLELPLSRLCELDAFRWFACHLLAHLPRFRDAYNSVVAAYRRANHVRNASHPVPDLAERDGWLEAPFWVWRKGDSHRSQVFTKQFNRELHLSDGRDVFVRLPLSPDRDATDAVAALQESSTRGIRFRTRALTTTLFTRLFLADLFVHGIGGAKYDEMTDRIIAEFYRVPVPEFLTLTATALLPVQPFPVTNGDRHRLQQRLRELRFHPEQFLSFAEQTEHVEILGKKAGLAAYHAVARKFRQKLKASGNWINPRGKRGQRPGYIDVYLKIQEFNSELETLVADQRDRAASELADVSRQLAANRILASREFSYCLFPADKLRRLTETIQRGEP